MLDAAGIPGFLDNLDEFKTYAENDRDADVQILFNKIAQDYIEGQLFRPGGGSGIRGFKGKPVESLMDVLNEAMDGAPLLLDGWGWNKEDRRYQTSSRIAGAFKTMIPDVTKHHTYQREERFVRLQAFDDIRELAFEFVTRD